MLTALLLTLAAAELDPRRTEVGVLPVISYDSDLGLGLGGYGVVARFDPERDPYLWRVEVLLSVAIKTAADGTVEVPFHDDKLILDLPGLLGGALRATADLRFRRQEDAAWYGLGHGAPATPERYRRTLATAALTLRHPVAGPVDAFARASLGWASLGIDPGGALASTPGLAGRSDHALLVFTGGLLLDTRDHEYAPTRGSFHELSVRASPGVAGGLTYAGVDVTFSGFVSLGTPRLVLGLRAAGDVLGGTVPFYELSALGGFLPYEGPGGAASVRGVPRQRYHGEVKVVANAELRAALIAFELFGDRFEIGAVAFADAGRVWASLGSKRADLDRAPFPIATGLGGGARLRWGETLIVRVDAAGSPTDETFGAYLDVGQVF